MEILKLGPAHADEFCRLRMMLFEDVGEIPPMKDMAADLAVSARALADATKSYYLSHIDKDLICFGIEAVSYTHLDVYKRQLHDCVMFRLVHIFYHVHASFSHNCTVLTARLFFWVF